MYIHVDTQDHKNIAGIAYLQTKLQEIYPHLKVDGMLGTETVLAFRSAIKRSFNIPNQGFDLVGVGIAAIQNLIMQAVQATGPAKFPTAGLHDGLWGKDTKGAIDYILDPLLATARFKAIHEEITGKTRPTSKLSKRTLATIRNRTNRHAPAIPLTYDAPNKLKEGKHWCSGMEWEVNSCTNSLLAKAMGHENDVVTIHQMLAAKYQICLEYYKGKAVGIIVVRPYESVPLLKTDATPVNGMIEGIYVTPQMRGVGVGTGLLATVRHRGKELGWSTAVFTRGPAQCSLEDTVSGVRTPKERVHDILVQGLGYKPMASVMDATRAERCVYNIN